MSKDVRMALVCFGAAVVFAGVGWLLGGITPYVGWLCTGVFAIYSGFSFLNGRVVLQRQGSLD